MSKHFEIEDLVFKDKIRDVLIVVKHVNTEAMMVDSLTNGLAFKVFNEHVT